MNSERVSTAIVGGGMMGICAAIELAKSGNFKVTLFEKRSELGGLCSSFRWNNLVWDRFYHVILSGDTNTLAFLQEIGRQGELVWRETKSGFYGDGKLVSNSSTSDFLAFPFLSFWQKVRLALGILYSSRIKDHLNLDDIAAKTWLTSVFGNRIYERIWDPLLRSKLGDARNKTSAYFIWTNIKRLYGARNSANKIEKMGYVRGGYHRIIDGARERLAKLGVEVKVNNQVTNIGLNDREVLSVDINGKKQEFNRVLLTVSCPEAGRILGPGRSDYIQALRETEYLSVMCVLLILKRRLSQYYVINLLDEDLPFTGIVEATNIVAPEDVGGFHLLYLPKYMSPDDPLYSLEDGAVINLFVDKLKKVFPNVEDDEIVHREVFRERYVQPIPRRGFQSRNIGLQTPVTGVYLANRSMIKDSTLNNNAILGIAELAANALNETVTVEAQEIRK